MPKPVDDLVETLLSNPDFYPNKSEKEQKAIAFAIAWKQYNKSSKKKRKKKSSEIINNNSISNRGEINNTNSTEEEKIGPFWFICHSLLGKGSFGEVYLVEKKDTGVFYAMKVLSKDKIMGKKIF